MLHPMTQLTSSAVGVSALDPLQLDLSKLRWKALKGETGFAWTEELWEVAEQDYRRFLALHQRFPRRQLVPSKLLDEVWHLHVLDTAKYRKDCDRIFGHFLDHYPYFGLDGEADQANLHKGFEETDALFLEVFGERMGHSVAARCEGHPCHVPSECACRAPGTCR